MPPLVLGVWLLVSLPHGFAQTLPNAGSLQQQINKERELSVPKELTTPVIPKAEPKKTTGGPKITVNQFLFTGNTTVQTQTLAAITAHLLGRSIEFSELESAAIAVGDYYRALGFVVKTSLPAQEIKNGIVTIEIVEAIFGKVVVDGPASKLINTQRIVETIYAAQPQGAKLNANAIDKALALVSDLAGIQIQGNFLEGSTQGQTDLVVTLKDMPLWMAEVSADNTGARSTGRNRIAANLAINSPFGMGDQFTANTLSTQGSEYIRMAHTVPVGYSGLKAGVNLSHLNYRLITQDYSALMARGTADAVGLESSYPLIRTRQSNFTAVFNIDRKHFVNETQGTVASDYASRLMSLGLNGSVADTRFGGGKTSFNLTSTGGTLDLSKSATQASDSSTTRTAGRFNKLRYSIARDQDLGRGLSFYSAFNGQWANKNLDSSEKFYLGGIYGVRAYPGSEAGGARGQLATLELRNRISTSSTWAGFYDFGRVLVNPSNDYLGASSLNKYALKGYGVAYGYTTSQGISLKATLARRVGNNPNPTATGNDQDGSLVKNRIWLNASVPF